MNQKHFEFTIKMIFISLAASWEHFYEFWTNEARYIFDEIFWLQLPKFLTALCLEHQCISNSERYDENLPSLEQ